MSIFVIIIGCYTAIDWITDIVIFINILSSLFNIAHSTAIDEQLRHHIRSLSLPSVAFVVADYFLHLHDWWISPSLLVCVYVFIVGLFSSSPTTGSSVTDWLFRHHSYTILSLLLDAFIFTVGWLVCCRLVSLPPRLSDFITFDWCHCLYHHQHLRQLWWVISSSCWSFRLHADCVSYYQWTNVTTIEG